MPSDRNLYQRLVESLMEPAFYPYPCNDVEMRQTSMSWLFFAGPHVYKIKKPLRMPILDASTRAKRALWCQMEVALNQRLAPDVYLSVAKIVEDENSFVMADQDSIDDRTPHELAVVMRRLPNDKMLAHMAQKDLLSRDHIDRLAHKLAMFHAETSGERAAHWGHSKTIMKTFSRIARHALAMAADSVTRGILDNVTTYLMAYVAGHRQLFDNRIRNLRICEGHGGLRADLVCFESEEPSIIGCIEYLDCLRYGDAASDLASLLVDLDLSGRADLADSLLHGYEVESGDSHLWELTRFYKCFRALNHGWWKAIESTRPELSFEQRASAREESRHLYLLAQAYATGQAASSIP